MNDSFDGNGASPVKDSFEVSQSSRDVVEDSYDSFDASQENSKRSKDLPVMKKKAKDAAIAFDRNLDTASLGATSSHLPIHDRPELRHDLENNLENEVSKDDSFESIPDSIHEEQEIDSFEASASMLSKDATDVPIDSKIVIPLSQINELSTVGIDSFHKSQPTPLKPEASNTNQTTPAKPSIQKNETEYDSFDDSPLKDSQQIGVGKNSMQRETNLSEGSLITEPPNSKEVFQGFVRANGQKISIDPKLLEESKQLLSKTMDEENYDPSAGDTTSFKSNIPMHKARSLASHSSSRSGFSSPVLRSFPSESPLVAKRGRFSTSDFKSPVMMKPEASSSICSPIGNNRTPAFELPKVRQRLLIDSKAIEVANPTADPSSPSIDNFFLVHELSKNNVIRKALVKVQITKFLSEPISMFCRVCENCECEMNEEKRCPKCNGANGKYLYCFEAEINDSSMAVLQCRFGDHAGKQIFGEDAGAKHKLSVDNIDKWYADVRSVRGKYFLMELNVLRNSKRTIYIVRDVSQKMDHSAIAQILKQKILIKPRNI